jgi:hypothetical protein
MNDTHIDMFAAGADRMLDDEAEMAGLEDLERVWPQDKCKDTKYWYFIHYEECVLCGAHHEYRERRYTERPCLWKDRHEFTQYACSDHF